MRNRVDNIFPLYLLPWKTRRRKGGWSQGREYEGWNEKRESRGRWKGYTRGWFVSQASNEREGVSGWIKDEDVGLKGRGVAQPSGSCDCFGFDLGSIYWVYAYAFRRVLVGARGRQEKNGNRGGYDVSGAVACRAQDVIYNRWKIRSTFLTEGAPKRNEKRVSRGIISVLGVV